MVMMLSDGTVQVAEASVLSCMARSGPGMVVRCRCAAVWLYVSDSNRVMMDAERNFIGKRD